MLFRLGNRIWSEGRSTIAWGLSLCPCLQQRHQCGRRLHHDQPAGSNRRSAWTARRRFQPSAFINAQTADMIAFDLAGNYENFYLGGEWTRFRWWIAAAAAAPTSTFNGGA